MTTALPETELGFSYEKAIDIDISETETPEWQRIRFIDSLDPQHSPITVNAQTYEDRGSPNEKKTAESWTASFFVQKHVTTEGAYLPEVQALIAATEPDALGAEAEVVVRWYDNPAQGGRAPVLSDCYSGIATVQMVRAQTGAAGEIDGWNVTLTGVGARAKATHPAKPAGV